MRSGCWAGREHLLSSNSVRAGRRFNAKRRGSWPGWVGVGARDGRGVELGGHGLESASWVEQVGKIVGLCQDHSRKRRFKEAARAVKGMIFQCPRCALSGEVFGEFEEPS